MKKAIGGLLVVSMLTVPHPADLNYMAYLALRSHSRVMYVQVMEEEKTQAAPGDIDLAMADMEENQRALTTLLRDRTATLGKLDARMDLLSYAKVALSEEQMSEYAEFMSRYREDAQNFNELLKTIEGGKNLNIAQKEILSENTDYDLVVNQLDQIINAQSLAIDNLTRTIHEGELLLELL